MPASVPFSPAEGRQVEPPPIEAGEIHLWTCSLDLSPDRVAQLARTLSPEERVRAARYRFDRHRRRYRTSRGTLRALLGAYLRSSPGDLSIVYGPSGKPFLANDSAALRFNLSHSAERMVLGVQIGRRIGVDLERVRAVRDRNGIAERFFAPEEVASLESLPEAQRDTGFFTCWTRKEALIKAHGEGVFASLNRFEVSLRPDAEPALVRLDGRRPPDEWSLHHFEPASGYLGALATDLAPAATVSAWSIDLERQRLPGVD